MTECITAGAFIGMKGSSPGLILSFVCLCDVACSEVNVKRNEERKEAEQ